MRISPFQTFAEEQKVSFFGHTLRRDYDNRDRRVLTGMLFPGLEPGFGRERYFHDHAKSRVCDMSERATATHLGDIHKVLVGKLGVPEEAVNFLAPNMAESAKQAEAVVGRRNQGAATEDETMAVYKCRKRQLYCLQKLLAQREILGTRASRRR
jgi:hypothetical protein